MQNEFSPGPRGSFAAAATPHTVTLMPHLHVRILNSASLIVLGKAEKMAVARNAALLFEAIQYSHQARLPAKNSSPTLPGDEVTEIFGALIKYDHVRSVQRLYDDNCFLLLQSKLLFCPGKSNQSLQMCDK